MKYHNKPQLGRFHNVIIPYCLLPHGKRIAGPLKRLCCQARRMTASHLAIVAVVAIVWPMAPMRPVVTHHGMGQNVKPENPEL